MSCAALDWHCSQITRLWFHIPHLHIHAVQRFIFQIPWPQEAAIMFLHSDHSPASLSLLNRVFVGCLVGVSGGTWEHLLPAVLVLASYSPESHQLHSVAAPGTHWTGLVGISAPHRALNNRRNKLQDTAYSQ